MGLLEKLKNLPERLSARLREPRDIIPTEKAERVTRAFGREGGEDVKEIVWTGHTVQTPQGKSYYPAVGLTNNGYYRPAEVQVYGGSEETWRWDTHRHATKPEAMFAADLQNIRREVQSPPKQAAEPPRIQQKVISPDYFPNVWRSQGSHTPSGIMVATVNIDPQEKRFYAGVHHFPKQSGEDVSVRWLHRPHATKEQAMAVARKFANRGTRSMWHRDGQPRKLAAEHKQDAAMGRGEIAQDSNVLQYRPKAPKLSR